MKIEPQKEHQWLQKLVGEWTWEHEMPAGPDKPSQIFRGTETVRSLGGLWVLCEGTGGMPGGGNAQMVMTLGYDPRKNAYVGTWVGSMMNYLWLYRGSLDATGKVLTLESEGPDMENPDGGMLLYRDVIEFLSDDHRTLTGNVLGKDGKWSRFMEAHYRRSK